MMKHGIGSLVLPALLVCCGVVYALVASKLVFTDLSPEEAKKKVKFIRICGIGMAFFGAVALVFMAYT
jgi:hypothetical protein